MSIRAIPTTSTPSRRCCIANLSARGQHLRPAPVVQPMIRRRLTSPLACTLYSGRQRPRRRPRRSAGDCKLCASSTQTVDWKNVQVRRTFISTGRVCLVRPNSLLQSPSVSSVLILSPISPVLPFSCPFQSAPPPLPPSQDTSLKLPVCNSRPHFAAAAWHCSSAALACMSHPLTLVFAGTVNVWQPKAAAE